MAYSPAFQFYYKDFRQDPNTIRMDTITVGAYWLLIMECWDRDNRLPNDLEFLADIARMELVDFEPIWTKRITRCFILDEKKNTFSHKRIAKEIAKQKAWSKGKSEAGKQGAAKRWKQKGNGDGTAIALPSPAIAMNDSSSSSSSSSSSKTLREDTLSGRSGIPRDSVPVNASVDSELGVWLDALAPILGAKNRHTMANSNRWEAMCIKAMQEQRSLMDILATLKFALATTESKYVTPDSVLKLVQTNSAKKPERLPTHAEKLEDDAKYSAAMVMPPTGVD